MAPVRPQSISSRARGMADAAPIVVAGRSSDDADSVAPACASGPYPAAPTTKGMAVANDSALAGAAT